MAILAVIFGLTVITLSDIYVAAQGSDQEEDAKQTSVVTLGIMCMLIGELFQAFQSVVEEFILKQGANGQEPYYMMGWEGVFGLIITTLVIIVA